MDAHELHIRKKELRQKMRLSRDTMDKALKKDYDVRINEALRQLAHDRKAKTIHTYLPIGSEINVQPAIDAWLKEGIRIICPKTLPARKLSHHVLESVESLEKGYFGTRHPAGPALGDFEADIILIPGLAFDHKNMRLGYGSGYYDAFLANTNSGYRVGLAYPFQLMPEIPTDVWDAPLHTVLCLNE